MDAVKLDQLKFFVDHFNSDPSILNDPSLSFFKDYIESFGGKVPSSNDQQSATSSSLSQGGKPGDFPGGMSGFPSGTPGYPGGMPGFPGGYPGGMPGFPGGMSGFPGGMHGFPGYMPQGPQLPSEILNDPEVMAAFSDPEVWNDVMSNLGDPAKQLANPKLARAIKKMARLVGFPGSIPGGMSGFPGGMPMPGFPGGYPGGMPGFHGNMLGFPGVPPEMASQIFNDPELKAALSDPEIWNDVINNPGDLTKHLENPKLARALEKLMSIIGPRMSSSGDS